MSKAENDTGAAREGEKGEGDDEDRKVARTVPSTLSTPELITEISREVKLLVKTQLDLAKAELRGDLAKEGKMVAGVGLSAILALLAVNLLFVTVVLALASSMPAWAAGLAVTGVIAVVAVLVGAIGWSQRVRQPLSRTRHELKEDVRWTKERIA